MFAAADKLKHDGYAAAMDAWKAKGMKGAHPVQDPMSPGGFVPDPWSGISLGMALMFGTAGLPHILMRFFTVKDAATARKSVLVTSGLIGYFYILTFIIGFGAIVFDPPNTVKQHGRGAPRRRARWVLPLRLHRGGRLRDDPRGRRGPDAGGAFGDQPRHLRQRHRARVTRRSTRSTSPRARPWSSASSRSTSAYIFEEQNVAFMVGLAFAVAASCNFPVLIMSLLWKGTTTLGAVVGGTLGLVSSIVMVVLSKAFWVTSLHHKAAIFPLSSPAIFSIPIAFIGIWLFSVLDRSARANRERAAYDAQFVRAETGIGALEAHVH